MNKKLIFLLLVLIYFQSIKAVSIPKKRITEDTEDTFEYSLNINLSHYLELLTKNGSAVENKTIFSNSASLSGKKGAVTKGTIYETLLEKNNNSNIVVFDSYDDAQKALNNHSIDYFICPKRMIGEIIQMKTENLTYIDDDSEQNDQFKSAVVVQNTENSRQLSNRILAGINVNQNLVSFKQLYDSWLGLDKGLKYINWKVPSNSDITINYLLNFDQEPYAYKDGEEKLGLIPQVAQMLSGRLSAKNNFIEANSQKDYISSIKNGTANITIGYFLNSELNDSELIVINTSIPSDSALVIRYENEEGSNEWKIQDSIEDFNKEDIGTVSQYEQNDTVKTKVKEYFSNSEITIYNNVNDLFSKLLQESIDGGVVDRYAISYYLENSDRIDYYSDILFNNSYGILFKDENFKNNFNKFLKETYDNTQRTSLFNEWKNADSEKTIEFNSDGNNKLFVAFHQARPLSYMENFQYKGYELALLEKFALEYNYSLIANTSSVGNLNGADVILGYQNITGEKAGDYFFSDSILTSYSVLAVRKDGKRGNLPLTALDKDYNKKADNKLDIPIKVGNQEALSKCQLPSTFSSDVISLECSASGLSRLRNLADEEIEFGETTDRINILYSSILADNLMKANKLFGENITTVSQASSNSGGNSSNSSNSTNIYRKSSSGLSTGGIIGITIPCCVVLAAVTGVVFATQGNAATNVGTDIDNSSTVRLKVPVQNVNIIPNTAENIAKVSVTNPA